MNPSMMNVKTVTAPSWRRGAGANRALVRLTDALAQSGPLTPRRLARLTPDHLRTVVQGDAPFSAREAADALDALRSLNEAVEAARSRRTGIGDLPHLLAAVTREAAPAIRLLSDREPERPERHALYAYRSGTLTVTVQGWDPRKWTPWHDHDCDALAVLVVEGSVREERLERDRIRRYRWGTGAVSTGDPAAPHRIGGGSGITIHAYTPKLAAMTIYAQKPSSNLVALRARSSQEKRTCN